MFGRWLINLHPPPRAKQWFVQPVISVMMSTSPMNAFRDTNLEFFFILGGHSSIHLDLWGFQGRHGHKLQIRLSSQLPCQPQEWFLKVVVALGTDVIVLKE
jgi:hypothetical protein